MHSYGLAKFLAYKASWILGSVRCVVGTADGIGMTQGEKSLALNAVDLRVALVYTYSSDDKKVVRRGATRSDDFFVV